MSSGGDVANLHHKQKNKALVTMKNTAGIDTSGFEALKLAMRQTSETLKNVAAGYAELTKKR